MTEKMHSPVIKPVVTSPYGWRTLKGKPQFHDGIDFVNKDRKDTIVFAIWDGEVCLDVDYYDESKRWTDGRHSGGNFVILKHIIDGKLYYTRYMHIDKNTVTKDQKIRKGQTLGHYADVGFSYGAHLHLDMYDYKWKKIDPTPVLRQYGLEV